MRLILGSQSPQRKEILSFYSIPFEQIPSHFDENLISFEGDPIKYALTLAEKKAETLAIRYPEATVLTADTVVFKEGQIFNKPSNSQENFEMLKCLNGSWHTVITAVTAQKGVIKASDFAETRVEFHRVADQELQLYHQAFQGLDKCGGYNIQLGGSIIIKRIEGCFYNVMGLPVSALQKVLKEMGINLWHYLLS